MKKFRKVIWVFIGILTTLILVDVVVLVVNTKTDMFDVTSEVIALTIATSGTLLAAWAQLDARRESRENKRIMMEIHALNREADIDEKVDKIFQKKLDEIIKMDRDIEKKLKIAQKKQ
jgi:type VI protein secretion system component VasK